MIRWKKFRTVLAAGLAACLAVGLLPSGARAASRLDPEQGGELTLLLGRDMVDFWDDLKDEEIQVDVYKVASVNADARYTAVGDFANNTDLDLALSLISQETDLKALTELVKHILFPDPITTPDPDAEETEEAEPKAAFDPIEELSGPMKIGDKLSIPAGELGLYLLVPHRVETKLYKYTFSPLLLPVPAMGTEFDAFPSTAPEGGEEPEDPDAPDVEEPEEPAVDSVDWQYSYGVYLKPERETKDLDLIIEKELQSYNATLGPVMFVFEITIEVEGKEPEVKYVGLNYTGAGLEWTKITGIPVGAKVTVREIYQAGGSYRLTSENGLIVEYDPNDPEFDPDVTPSVRFTNDYDDGLIPSSGVVNHYDKVGQGWAYDKSLTDNNAQQGGVA